MLEAIKHEQTVEAGEIDEWAKQAEKYSSTKETRAYISQILDTPSKEMSSREKYYKVSQVGYQNLLSNGAFFYDPLRRESYWFDTKSKILFNNTSEEYKAHLSTRLDLGHEEAAFKHLLGWIADRTREYAERVEPHRHSYFDKNKMLLYFNHQPGRMLALDGQNIAERDNGDGCLFLWDEKWEPVQPEYGREGLLREHITSKLCLDESESEVTLEEAELLLERWVLARFFGKILPERPILALVGEHGSAKTSTGESLGRLLFGTRFSVLGLEDPKEDGVIAYLSAKPLGILDNADQPIRWLPDLLARSATGMAIPRRVLYTTNDLAEYPVDIFLVITARQTPWARLDVIDRLLLLRTKRPSSFIDKDRLFQKVVDHRPAIIGELLTKANRAIRRLRDSKNHEDSPYRLAAFYRFALTTAEEEDRERLKTAFEKIVKVQQALHAEEEENLLTLLSDWLKHLPFEDRDIDVELDGDWTIPLRVSEIYTRLAKRAKEEGFKFTVKSPLSLGHKLGQIRGTLRTSGIPFVKDHDSKGNFWRFGLPKNNDAENPSEPSQPSLDPQAKLKTDSPTLKDRRGGLQAFSNPSAIVQPKSRGK